MKTNSKTRIVNETGHLRPLAPSTLTAPSAKKSTIGAVSLLLASGLSALAEDNRAPEVPGDIAVPAFNKVHFHGYAIGFQVYTWNGSDWGAAVPDATLFDNDGNIVATHFAGPTWQSNSGSSVVGALVPPPLRVTVDTNSIPWLRLTALTSEGPGILDGTTYIHRVNTVGGKAPAEPGAFVGQVARVPYTADYFFYRKSHN